MNIGGINRVRCCPHQPGLVAVWCDSGVVKLLDGSNLLKDLSQEAEPSSRQKAKADLRPLHSHTHTAEGYSVDWSPVRQGRLATGDCNHKIHVWEPADGGRWQVSRGGPRSSTPFCQLSFLLPLQVGGAFAGHQGSVEDLQWSPTEETVRVTEGERTHCFQHVYDDDPDPVRTSVQVFASCSVDKTIRVFDTRERSKPMITVAAHDTDVNVISWNRLVTYMLASGADDGTLRIWDLRAFSQVRHCAAPLSTEISTLILLKITLLSLALPGRPCVPL